MQSSRKRSGVILVLHALLWAAAMLLGAAFFKDRPWADEFFMWMTVGFSLANGVLLLSLRRSGRC